MSSRILVIFSIKASNHCIPCLPGSKNQLEEMAVDEISYKLNREYRSYSQNFSGHKFHKLDSAHELKILRDKVSIVVSCERNERQWAISENM